MLAPTLDDGEEDTDHDGDNGEQKIKDEHNPPPGISSFMPIRTSGDHQPGRAGFAPDCSEATRGSIIYGIAGRSAPAILMTTDNDDNPRVQMARPVKICCVCGARPNFMKIAPIVSTLQDRSDVETLLVHTGQHYDTQMSRQFFEDLNLPAPDINLNVGSGSHALQTAKIMTAFEPVCLQHQPDWVIVVGDVNSTIACAMVAVKLGIRVAHVESGLRSGDRTMPEEINRILTDAISDLLFVTEPSGVENLRREGIPDQRVHHVGNVMIDSLLSARARAEQSDLLTRQALTPRGYTALTLHRPANVDHAPVLRGIMDAVEEISRRMPVVFPLHPRTRRRLDEFGMSDRFENLPGLRLLEPLGYLDFLKLIANARVVMSDSGGIQEETTILGVPCLTLRNNTERPITISEGTNRLVGVDPMAILRAFADVEDTQDFAARVPALWDGQASTRIVERIMACQSSEDAPARELTTV